jgi:hypothetical protein
MAEVHAAPEPAYTVTSYDCKEHLADINRLADQVANEQEKLLSPYDPPDFNYLTRFQRKRFIKPFDYRVMPWTSGCTRDGAKISVRHYVVQMTDGDKEIVGWLLAERKKRFNQTYIYLSEISTIRVRSSSYRGVADALLTKLKQDAEADREVAFVFLYPLRTELEDVYRRRGYSTYKELTASNQYPTVRHMFMLTPEHTGKDIPMKLMDALKADADTTRDPIAKATVIANDGAAKKVEGAAELAAFFKSGLARTLKTLPPLMDEVRNALDNIQLFVEAGDAMTKEQEVYSLLEVVRSVPTKLPMFKYQLAVPTRKNPAGIPTGGRRRTRRRKTRRRLTHKRKHKRV